MTLIIKTYILGPLQNNTYLLADDSAGRAVIVDPSFGSEIILNEIKQNGWVLDALWCTHAHFDHTAGIPALLEAGMDASIGLHALDLPLWQRGGGAGDFGITFPDLPAPDLEFTHGQMLKVGLHTVEVRHTPGHTPGHVVFHLSGSRLLLCGDLIFYHSIGRTDLPGGDSRTLTASIRGQVFTLPPDTRLLSGHGPESHVAEEQACNPYLY